MRCSRRNFLRAAGVCGIAASLAPSAAFASQSGGTDPRLARHVLDRCGFGPRPGDVDRLTAHGIDHYLESQLAPHTVPDKDCARRVRRLETLRCPTGELFEYKEDFLWKELATGKLLQACYSERQLYEVMVDFWTDHFNIDSSKGDCPWLKTADDRDVIRKHALGTFPQLLRASAMGPAMLWYLDGRLNMRRRPEETPNENYARELLELHTLGVHGGYTQQDVMEVARCLTGWTVRTDTWLGKGRVEFKADRHDDGEKHVLGTVVPAGQGSGDVDHVLAIVARHPATARYLAARLCRRFIGPEPPPEATAAVATAFAQSNGDIPETLRALFRTDAFLTPTGNKFKRPFRFLVSALRATNAEVTASDALLDYLSRMGQSPFQFPTPDGYPEEAEPWYGSMLWRWHFVYALSRNEVPGVTVDWRALTRDAGGREALARRIVGRALQQDEQQFVQAGDAPALILASPAYQGC